MRDPYLNDATVIARLLSDYEKHGSLVIAYDFDDTVYDFHKKGSKYPKVIELLRKAKQAGCFLIVWTGNEDTELVKRYLNEKRIPYDSINENPPYIKSSARKIYANLYLDDRGGLSAACAHLEQFLLTTSSTQRRTP